MRIWGALWTFAGVYAFFGEFMRVYEDRGVSSIRERVWIARNGFDKLRF